MSGERLKKFDDDVEKAEKSLGRALAKLQKAKNARDDRHCTVLITLPRASWDAALNAIGDSINGQRLKRAIVKALEGQ